MTSFDDHERSRWTGRAPAYERSFAALCAHPAGAVLDAAGVTAQHRVLHAGTVAALAGARCAAVVAMDAEPNGCGRRSSTSPGLPAPPYRGTDGLLALPTAALLASATVG